MSNELQGEVRMESNIIYFYTLFFLILSSAVGVIFAPRMYLSVIFLFALVCFSSGLYFGLGATYAAVFQFILCGIFLSGYLFLLLKKIGRMKLELKLNSISKILVSLFIATSLGVLTVIFFFEESENSLYSVFNFIKEKSFDAINFDANIFPLHLVIIFVFVSAVVLRIFLSKLMISNGSEDKE